MPRPAVPTPRRSLIALAPLLLVAAACRDEGPGSCTLEIPGGTERVLVAGTSGQARATATCTHDPAPVIRWSVSDTTRATVTPDGRITGRVPGELTLRATVTGRNAAPVSRDLRVVVVPPFLVIATPSPLALRPGEQRLLGVSRLPTDYTPTGFSSEVTFASGDSCVARVAPGGQVTGGRPGTTTIAVALRDAPGVRDLVATTVAVPAASALRLERITAGTPAQPVPDSGAVRGEITVEVSADYGALLPQGGRFEVRIGGQAVGSLLVGPSTPGVGVVRVPLTVNTAVRDAAGALRFANGLQRVDVVLQVADLPALPGCAPVNLGQTVSRFVTLANLP